MIHSGVSISVFIKSMKNLKKNKKLLYFKKAVGKEIGNVLFRSGCVSPETQQ